MQADLKLFQKLSQKLINQEQQEGVVKPIKAKDLYKTLDLKLSNEGLDETQFESLLEDVILSTPRTSTKLFFNQLFGGRNAKGTLGELMAVMLNNSMYTYKVGGPQVGIEKAIISEVCKLLNFGSNADGTFPPGGSMSNFMAMLMARDAFNRAIKFEGVSETMVIYTSEASHYSITKNAMFGGIGIKNIRRIETNAHGQMNPDALQNQIEEDLSHGLKPFFVNATAGTTVLGAFDDIQRIHNVTKHYDKLWLHVDGAYCGAVMFSKTYKHLIEGVQYADSFCFNAHKMLNVPLSCSILITKEKHNLKHSFACEADYLYQTDDDEFNLGKTSLQCGRRNDALKFWTLWKSVGTKGLEKMVNKQFDLADVARDYIKNHPDYRLYSYENSISICFNYKDIDPKDLCNSLYQDGKLMVGYGEFNGETFVRLVSINSNNSKADVLNFFKVLETYVEQHYKELLTH
jgi:sulfinoalanine decarboxylase/sulfinoalanine decarboxylase/aspartate 1-decarboxylase